MTFTDEAWTAIADIRAAIDAHPFVSGLHDGTLAPKVFLTYLAQDSHYLTVYARVLAHCAAQAPHPGETAMWAQRAHGAVAVERVLHSSHLAGTAPVDPSPTCVAYTSYLSALAAHGGYPVLAAGVLPCFWLYDDVGRRFKQQLGDVAGHPFGDWIATYGDPAFTAATEAAKQTVDQLAAESGPTVRRRMLAAFTTASRYEWMFWDAAWREEQWPV